MAKWISTIKDFRIVSSFCVWEILEPFGLPIFKQIKHETDNEGLFIDGHFCVNINTQGID